MNRSSKRRDVASVNAGSMADIAFLLLIFFLVTAVILEDKGILVKLPIWVDEPVADQLNDNNVLSIKVNGSNQLLIEGVSAQISSVKERTKVFITNPNQSDDLPSSPKNAIISLQHDRGTNYDTYLRVYNELKAAYNELRNELSERLYGMDYESLTSPHQREVRDRIPMTISEAEPTQFFEAGPDI